MRQITGASTPPSLWQKAVTAVSGWLEVGRSPKIRDPQNAVGGGSSAGVTVNDHAAMRLSAFFACVRLLSSTIGSLPLQLYRKRPSDKSPTLADEAQLSRVFDSPNADQTPLDYIEFLVISLLLRGNHYARKMKEGSRLIGLEPVRPDIVAVRRRSDGRIGYRWSHEGEHYDLTEDDVFHVRGFGGGPLGGLSTIAYARESLGIAIAADRTAGAMFANGLKPSGGVKVDKPLTPEQRTDFYQELEKRFTGPDNAGKPFVFEFGSSWESISMNADDAQLLESRSWSVEEICRWAGVPPFMIGHNEKASGYPASLEQQVLTFQKFTLNPYLIRIQQSIRKQLLSPAERASGLYAKFNMEAFLAADSAARARFHESGLRNGWRTINEVREKEELPPIEGGDVARVQAQNVPLEDALRDAVESGLREMLPTYLAAALRDHRYS